MELHRGLKLRPVVPDVPEGGLGGLELRELGLRCCDSPLGGLLPSLHNNPALCDGLEARAGSSVPDTAWGLLEKLLFFLHNTPGLR